MCIRDRRHSRQCHVGLRLQYEGAVTATVEFRILGINVDTRFERTLTAIHIDIPDGGELDA